MTLFIQWRTGEKVYCWPNIWTVTMNMFHFHYCYSLLSTRNVGQTLELTRVTMKLPVLYSCVSVPLVLPRLGRHLNCVMCEEGAQNRGLCDGHRAAAPRPATTLPEQCLSLALPHRAARGCCSEKITLVFSWEPKVSLKMCHKSCIEKWGGQGCGMRGWNARLQKWIIPPHSFQ